MSIAYSCKAISSNSGFYQHQHWKSQICQKVDPVCLSDDENTIPNLQDFLKVVLMTKRCHFSLLLLIMQSCQIFCVDSGIIIFKFQIGTIPKVSNFFYLTISYIRTTFKQYQNDQCFLCSNVDNTVKLETLISLFNGAFGYIQMTRAVIVEYSSRVFMILD